MPEWIDQIGRSVTVTENPQRIVSLVPSQTEFLADLGLDNEVVGLTRVSAFIRTTGVFEKRAWAEPKTSKQIAFGN